MLRYSTIHLSEHNPAEVIEFLESRVGAIHAGSLASLGHGEWSRGYFFRARDERDLVVRFSGTDQDFQKDTRAMTYAGPRLPIPRVLEVGAAFGAYYAISERAFGEFIEERDAGAMTRLLPSLVDALDAMRAVDISDSRGFGLWRGDGSAPYASWRDFLHHLNADPPSSRKHGWRGRLDHYPGSREVFERGFAAMEQLIPFCPDQRHLVHSDLLYFNVLVANDRITSVLDWGSSLYGDFLWDVAWFTFWQPWYTAWASVDIRGAAERHLPAENFAERMRCYEIAIGLDGMAYQAFAGYADNLAWTTRRVLGLIDASASASA